MTDFGTIKYQIFFRSTEHILQVTTSPSSKIGPTQIHAYFDRNKDRNLDYVAVAGRKDKQVFFTEEFTKSPLYRGVFRDFKGWDTPDFKNSGIAQGQFETVLSSAANTFEVFKTALKENRVKPRGEGTMEFDVRDAHGKTLFEIGDIQEEPKPNGRAEVTQFTITVRTPHRETSVTVDDPDMLGSIQAKLDELRHPEAYKQLASNVRHGVGRRHHPVVPQSDRHVANR